MKCPKFFLHILTEQDGETFCRIRAAAIAGTLTFFGLVVANYVQHAVFDPLGYAGGLGGMLAGVGAALKLKDGSVPPPPPQN